MQRLNLSKEIFVVILVVAVLVSSVISAGVSVMVIRGAQGPKGDTGVQGPQGPTGPQGSPGIQGVKGDTGPAGPQGATGETGAVGPAGPQGIAGVNGTNGINGLNGSTGVNGTNGANGANGSAWYSGLSVPSNSLGVNGDLYLNTATGDVYNKTGNAWTLAGNIEGPQGNTGATGPAGPQGATGYFSVYIPTGPSVDIPGISNGNLTLTDPTEANGYPYKLDWVVSGESSGGADYVSLYQNPIDASTMSQRVVFPQSSGVAFDLQAKGVRLEVTADGYDLFYADCTNETVNTRIVVPMGDIYIGTRLLQFMVLNGLNDGSYATISNITMVQFQ